jgi:hypothetical protein
VLSDGFLEEAQSGLLVSVGRQQEVDGLTVPVDSAVEISPLALDLDVRLVHPPALAYRALVTFPECGFQLRREFLSPAADVGMVDFDATLYHHLFQIPVAERVSQVPADAGQNDVFFDAVTFEVDHEGNLSGSVERIAYRKQPLLTNATEPSEIRLVLNRPLLKYNIFYDYIKNLLTHVHPAGMAGQYRFARI